MRSRVSVGACLALMAVVNGCVQPTSEPSAADEPAAQEGLASPGGDANLATLKSMGFSLADVEDCGDHYVIEGDIVVAKGYVASLAKSTQRCREEVVDYSVVPSIRVMVHNSLSSWAQVVADAVYAWNYRDSHLYMTIVTSSPDITVYSDESPDCPDDLDDLPPNVCAQATWPENGQPGCAVSINVSKVNSYSYREKLYIVTHELGHCIGFYHTDYTSAPIVYGTPSTDATSIMNSQQCGSEKYISMYDNAGLQSLYGESGRVSGGTHTDLDAYRSLYRFRSANNWAASALAGMATSKSSGYVYAWYTNGTVSAGWSSDLDMFLAPTTYTLAPGRTPSDVVGFGISLSNYCYAWYSNGTVSWGNHTDLDYNSSPVSYTLKSGKTPADVVAMAISGTNKCYAFYSDGTGSYGNHVDLDYYGTFTYSAATGKSVSDIRAIAIRSDSVVLVWYD